MPEHFAGFTLERELGRGGMGSAWLARDPAGRPVVLKRILPEHADDPRFVKRFLREAKLASALDHPNVVRLLASGDEGGTVWLSLEYVEGCSLREVARGAREQGRPLPVAAVVRALSDACLGLHAAHELRGPDGALLGMVHRDVSPDNLLLSTGAEVKVTDFGIARVEGGTQTSGGQLWGKHAYMAPEQLRGVTLDRRVDVFALGVVLYELLASRRPFVPQRSLTILEAVLYHDPPPIRLFRRDLPPALEALLTRLLEKEPEARPPHALAVHAALLALLPELGPETPGALLPFASKGGAGGEAQTEEASPDEVPTTRER